MVPDCARDLARGWSGLRVRIGMHEGPVNLEYNSVMNRFDYFGPTVNVASRVEAVGVCGSVAVTDDVLNQVINGTIPHFDNPYLVYEGNTKLKGVSESLHITFLTPSSLQVRKACIVRMVEAKWARAAEAAPNTYWGSPAARPAAVNDENSRLSDSTASMPSIHRTTQGYFALDRIACATIGNVFLRTWAAAGVEDLNDSLARLLGFLDRTDGTVVSLLGTSLTVGWNTSRTCRDHLDQALHYTSLLQKHHRTQEPPPPPRKDSPPAPKRRNPLETQSPPAAVSGGEDAAAGPAAAPPGLHSQHVGICSGSVQRGSVGSRTQRFATVFGTPVNLSGELARAAAGYGTLALYVALSDDPVVVKKHLTRPVDRWSLRPAAAAAGAASVTVHEVNAALVETWLAANGVFPEGMDTPWEWSEAYCAAFKSGEVSAIEAHVLENPLASHTLSLVAEKLRSKTRVPPCVYV
eukprot:gene4726-7260_t